ncbi:hypothetical protein SAMN05660831_01153 [Thiohalospira halophila DSM 15071]|uniref:Cytochrome c domain-containing protein n=1 Tax=Thiohalospira halophila DSM 15071 TaxID=1123397 RepID=A0A1I1QKX3_9GAMM|nr:hypothetical protein [Thiohalospira halophila]SFD22774.1 hypothetical protein SAMN05660831_01153 [Thiohalospira halophila DSM 15071]
MFRHLFVSAALFAVVAGVWPQVGEAMPAFARQYEVSCAACHSAFPKLNGGGESFAGNNMKLPGWEDQAASFGDDRLALPKIPPLAVRAQGFFQVREGRVAKYDEENPTDPPTLSGADNDLQSPYLIKLLSSAPLSENLTYYFYGIMAEKGGNGSFLIEDAWFGYQDAFGTGIDATLGQFQVSDLMFARETRLTFQDYMVYRMADITYDRGLILSRALGPVDLAVGAVNGNGIKESATLNAPGYARPDHTFDDDHEKSAFTRLGFEVGGIGVGIMGLSGGWQGVDTTSNAVSAGNGPDSDIRIGGLDLSGRISPTLDWYAQYLQVTWTDFLDGEDVTWDGGFAGVDWIPNDRWAFSALYNHTDAGDLDGSETVYDGIDMQTVSLTASYYFMRNVKGLVEVNADLLDTEDPDVHPYGHLTGEDYLLMGFDAAF